MVFPFAESARGLELMRVQYARSVPLMRQRVSTQNGRANCRPPNSGGFGNFLAFRVPAKPADARPGRSSSNRIEAPYRRSPSEGEDHDIETHPQRLHRHRPEGRQ